MKSIILLLYTLCIINISQAFNVRNDTISLKLTPDSICKSKDINYVIYSIINNSSDTLLTTVDVFLEGLAGNFLGIPKYNRYCPNILILKNKNYQKLEGDVTYHVNYYKFPSLLILPPNSRKIIKVNIMQFTELLSEDNWSLYGYIRLARKKDLDSVVCNFYNNRIEEYRSSFIYSDSIQVKGYLTDSLSSFYSCNKDYDAESINLIKEVFRIRKAD